MDNPQLADVKAKMLKSIDVTRSDLASIRTGRATPALVENIMVATYGGSTKLKVRELATITTSDSKTILIVPFDPSTKEDIIKGIQEGGSGLNPISDGENIRLTIPPLSQERRQEYLKLAKTKLEAGRVMLRQIRHDEMNRLKRAFEAKEITEDDKKRIEKHLQDLTDTFVKEIDEVGVAKEAELMQI